MRSCQSASSGDGGISNESTRERDSMKSKRDSEKGPKQMNDHYQFLLCCNLKTLIAAWEAWDGESPLIVNGREVDERALVYAMQELGHDVVIG